MKKHFHFIAIGGAAMHNLTIALHKNGYKITGSDDEIFDPARSNLEKYGLLPEKFGWFPEKITKDIDAIILGMHAHKDNPELQKALELGLKIYSYPEFVYNHSKNKKRVVVGGSHGKTTTTGMIMHVLREAGVDFDYVVGSSVKGFDVTVRLSDADTIVIEGDEYLSSALDPSPKFHHYYPHLAVITGIAWDHINVFKTFDEYKKQFRIFGEKIEKGGKLFYFSGDENLKDVVGEINNEIEKVAYYAHPYYEDEGKTFLKTENFGDIEIKIFGNHNMQNISAAKSICNSLGVNDEIFYKAIASFEGTGKRLEKVFDDKGLIVFSDFAHAPSKVKATVKSVKEKYPDKMLIAVFELHTYSSLNKKFLPQYKGALDAADKAIVYYNKHTLELKRLPMIEKSDVEEGFARNDLIVMTDRNELIKHLKMNYSFDNTVLLMMSSGNFSGIDVSKLGKVLVKPLRKNR
jgi:UDP-N-acetylmuramate: L-alanyl-gamma-D-glutamyl-meso-diaminopimelate ligase